MLGMERVVDEQGNIIIYYKGLEVRGGREVRLGDSEHSTCTVYQLLSWVLPNRRINAAQPAIAHHHPTTMESASDFGVGSIARGAIDAWIRMVLGGKWPLPDREMCEDFLYRNEKELSKELNLTQPTRCTRNRLHQLRAHYVANGGIVDRDCDDENNEVGTGTRLEAESEVEDNGAGTDMDYIFDSSEVVQQASV